MECTNIKCAVPENIHTPLTEGIGISWGNGQFCKKCMKLNWNFQRGGGVLQKVPSVGEVWTFSGITQSADFDHSRIISLLVPSRVISVKFLFTISIPCQADNW